VSTLPNLICPVCGAENPTTRQFCRRCASDLHAVVPPSAAPITHAVAATTTTTPTAPSPLRPILIGGGIALVIVVLLGGLLLVLGGSPAASSSPEPTASGLPTAAPTPTAGLTAPPVTAAPTPTTAPVTTTAPTATTPPGTTPKVDSFSAPHTASCTATNGTSTPGFIHVSWAASNATGIRLSIDPPSPSNSYNNGYLDYPAVGSDDVPFTCNPPASDANGAYHLYVVTTLHTTGHYAYRYLKVYVKA
jgi:hypothetical protein